jgi:hypothetical protein
MNNFELDKQLKAAQVPPIEEDYMEDFPQAVLARIRSTSLRSPRRQNNWMPRLVWGGGVICACLLIEFVLGDRHAQTERATVASTDPLANVRVIRETLTMFPNQIRAIVEDEHGIQLVISEKPDVPTSPPLYVRICNGKQCASFVTFSGQQVQIAGQTMTVLSDMQGGIILFGNDFAWSSREPVSTNGNLKIEVTRLDAASI